MPAEAFLINPVKRRKRRRNAWPGQPKKHKRAAQVGWSSRKVGIRGYAKRTGATYPRFNPLEEGVLILGNSPRRKRRKTVRRRRNVVAMNRPRRRVRRRRTRLYNAPRIRRRRRRSNLPALYNAPAPARRRRRRRSYAVARRSRRRSYRRNPATALLRSRTIDFRDPMTLVAPILTGIVAKIATEKVPDMMKLTGNQRVLGQIGVAVGGGFLLGNFLGPVGASIWVAVSAAEVLSGYVNKMLAQIQAPTVSGIGYPAGGLGAYTNEYGLGAYPNEMESYGNF